MTEPKQDLAASNHDYIPARFLDGVLADFKDWMVNEDRPIAEGLDRLTKDIQGIELLARPLEGLDDNGVPLVTEFADRVSDLITDDPAQNWGENDDPAAIGKAHGRLMYALAETVASANVVQVIDSLIISTNLLTKQQSEEEGYSSTPRMTAAFINTLADVYAMAPPAAVSDNLLDDVALLIRQGRDTWTEDDKAARASLKARFDIEAAPQHCVLAALDLLENTIQEIVPSFSASHTRVGKFGRTSTKPQ
jgi:hypothetical protein